MRIHETPGRQFVTMRAKSHRMNIVEIELPNSGQDIEITVQGTRQPLTLDLSKLLECVTALQGADQAS